jgi:hypothetical protein
MSIDPVRYLVLTPDAVPLPAPEPMPRSLIGRTRMALEIRARIAELRRTYEAFRLVGGYGPALRQQIDAMADRHDAVRPWFMPHAKRAT